MLSGRIRPICHRRVAAYLVWMQSELSQRSQVSRPVSAVDKDSSLKDVVPDDGVVLEDVDVLDPGGISSAFYSSWKSLRGASLITPGKAVVASLD